MIDPALRERIDAALYEMSDSELEEYSPIERTSLLRSDWRLVVLDNVSAALAQAPAAPPTCATCRWWQTHHDESTVGECTNLNAPPVLGARVEHSFGCNRHVAAPRPASAATREES